MTVEEALRIIRPQQATAEALKKAYRDAVKKYHPDHGGDTEIMKLVNAAHDVLKGMKWSLNQANNAADLSNIADTLMALWGKIKTWPGLRGEVIGTWLWVSGNTYKYRDLLKDHGFKFSPTKKTWYYYEGEYRKRSARIYSMDDIRYKYGNVDLDNAERQSVAA